MTSRPIHFSAFVTIRPWLPCSRTHNGVHKDLLDSIGPCFAMRTSLQKSIVSRLLLGVAGLQNGPSWADGF